MATILITGASGIIGSVLTRGLAPKHAVRGLDLPEDLARVRSLSSRLHGVETVIHLARERHPPEVPAELRGGLRPRNVQIDVNVLSAVIEAGAPRLVLASSVHADDFRSPFAARPVTVPGSYHPATPYGTHKLIAEEVGRILAARFSFEFVAVRLGGVTPDDSVKRGAGRTATWLSHRDLLAAVAACVRSAPVPGRSTVFYAVSDNADRVHDTTNPFGWRPKDDSAARGSSQMPR